MSDKGPYALPVEHHNVLVIGSGVAGLSTALALGECTIVSEQPLGEGGSTHLAQGGIAAATALEDNPNRHSDDTIRVSGGLAVKAVVRDLIADGPAALKRLIDLGANFDRDEAGELALGREAGHSARRIAHANGDATGAEVARALTQAARSGPSICALEGVQVLDLVRSGDQVLGVITRTTGRDNDPDLRIHLAGAVVLATGGYGYCFGRTTNPASNIGTGIAMAARAGAAIADMEFVQFHPTALAVAGSGQLPLLTEALRGEGATLVDEAGQRYLLGVHPDAELAPRDVVARANYRQIQAGNTPYLDARLAIGDTFATRFPTVFRLAQAAGLDPRTQALPVSPAAHYCMGGIATDSNGATSLTGLWATGEVASTGLHGANRLASNSLLEGLIMGRRVADSITQTATSTPQPRPLPLQVPSDIAPLLRDPPTPTGHVDTSPSAHEVEATIRDLLWNHAGVERTEPGLTEAANRLNSLRAAAAGSNRTRTMHTVADLVIKAALQRDESRGAHYRTDRPLPDPRQAKRSFSTPLVVTAITVTTTQPIGLASELGTPSQNSQEAA